MFGSLLVASNPVVGISIIPTLTSDVGHFRRCGAATTRKLAGDEIHRGSIHLYTNAELRVLACYTNKRPGTAIKSAQFHSKICGWRSSSMRVKIKQIDSAAALTVIATASTIGILVVSTYNPNDRAVK